MDECVDLFLSVIVKQWKNYYYKAKKTVVYFLCTVLLAIMKNAAGKAKLAQLQ